MIIHIFTECPSLNKKNSSNVKLELSLMVMSIPPIPTLLQEIKQTIEIIEKN